MDILLNEPSPIPSHAIAAMLAIVLGGVQLCMKKGTKIHKALGYAWVGLMLTVSVSSFFIYGIKLWGNYSYIHVVSVFTIFSIGLAVYYARIGNIKSHKKMMIMLYVLALILTGLFTLVPGRVMHQVVFG